MAITNVTVTVAVTPNPVGGVPSGNGASFAAAVADVKAKAQARRDQLAEPVAVLDELIEQLP